MSDAKSGSDGDPAAPRARRPYIKPELVEYGSIAILTLGAGTIPKPDGKSGTARP